MTSLSSRPRLATALLVVLSALVWLVLCLRLKLDWQLNPQYAHGWIVPLLVMLLFRLRWADRPEEGLVGRRLWPVILIGLTAALFPVQLMLHANPDWRVPLWLWAMLATGITLACVAHQGGVPWIYHFGPAILLMLFAIPWPSMIEESVSRWLLGGVIAITAETLNFIGLGVVQSGNTLLLSQGQLGVEEACSGIRSLHGNLLVAYLLGELGKWRWSWRLGLLVLAVAYAIILNSLRAMILTWQAVEHGTEHAAQLHDRLGQGISIVALVLLVATFFLFENGRDELPNLKKRSPVADCPSPSWGVVASFLLFTGIVTASEAWFDVGERELGSRRLVVDWKFAGEEIVHGEISPRAHTLLRFSEGKMATWRTKKGVGITAYDFYWNRDRISLFNSVHRPDICLPSVGLRLVETIPFVSVKTRDGMALDFKGYQFESHGRPVYVWFGVWDGQLNAIDLSKVAGTRLRNTWEGKRVRSRQSLELILSDSESWSAAEAELVNWVQKSVRTRL